MSKFRFGDRGSVTAEFAVAIPAVLVLVGLLGAAFNAALTRLELQRQAALIARELGRGGDPAVINQISLSHSFETRRQGALICVTVSATNTQFTEVSCALDHGH